MAKANLSLLEWHVLTPKKVKDKYAAYSGMAPSLPTPIFAGIELL